MSRPLNYPSSDTRSEYARRINVGLSRDFSMARYDGFLNAFEAAAAHCLPPAPVVRNDPIITGPKRSDPAYQAAAYQARKASGAKPTPRVKRTPEEQKAHIKELNKAGRLRAKARKAAGNTPAVKVSVISMTREEKRMHESAQERARYAKKKAEAAASPEAMAIYVARMDAKNARKRARRAAKKQLAILQSKKTAIS